MSNSNKKAKARLERIFGKVDMFVAADVDKHLELLNIKTYKVFERTQRYKGVPISQQLSQRLTYHHLKHRRDGGDSSIENGALVGELRHQFLHSLTREEEEIANNIIRAWKIDFLAFKGNGEITNYGSFEPDFTDVITIPVYDNREKKNKRIKNPTRAEKKRQTQKLIEEYEEEEFER